jgi:parallel beta-helix repeat protein
LTAPALALTATVPLDERMRRLRMSLAVVLVVSSGWAPRARPAAASPTVALVVDTELDNAASICSGSDNDCSLRGAIGKINSLAATGSTITFDGDIDLIGLLSPLPALVVTGTTITGNGGLPRLDGLFMTAGDVLTVNAPQVRIGHLTIVNGEDDSAYADILLVGGTGIEIHHNYLGTLPPGPAVTDCTPDPGGSAVQRNSQYGIWMGIGLTGSAGAGNGSAYIHSNTIGCHGTAGVTARGTDYAYVGEAPDGSAPGNFIGTHGAARTALPNGDGVQLHALGADGARFNVVRNNVIAGNQGHGVWLKGNGTSNANSTASNVVAGNRIGTHPLGLLGNGQDGVYVSDGAYWNQIGGAAAGDGNVISGNAVHGVAVTASDATGILGNTIGLSPDGTSGQPNFGNGVMIGDSDGTVVGGYPALFTVVPARNVISSNEGHGVMVSGSAAVTYILDNYIGTNAAGSAAIGNGGSGVYFNVVAAGGTITGNVISGNLGAGIALDKSSYVSITANVIGLNAAGTAAVPNARDGVALNLGVANVIGGDHPAEGNTISGNNYFGVYLADSDDNLIDYNLIGLNAAGTAALGNGMGGIGLFASDDNQIGNRTSPFDGLFVPPRGSPAFVPAPTQLVAGNDGDGVFFGGSYNNFLGLSTWIGVDLAGNPAGNGFHGVFISHSSDNHIYAHTITNNGLDGVAVVGDDSQRNMIVPTRVFANGGLPIDLGNDGHTPNDPGDGDGGPHGLLNHPVLAGAAGDPLVITGTACANCQVIIYRALGDPAKPGGGGEFMGWAGVDASGNFSAPLTFWPDVTERDLTFQTWSLTSEVSELSPRPILYLPLLKRP